jgi:hypothetical protein
MHVMVGNSLAGISTGASELPPRPQPNPQPHTSKAYSVPPSCKIKVVGVTGNRTCTRTQ